jgi:hypothetical protein
MSITVNQAPSGYPSAHEELWHVVESTNKSTAGFQYVFDIYDGATLLTRVKNSPYGTDKLGVLDVGNIVRSLLPGADFPSGDLNEFPNNTELGTEVFFTDYDVRYGEVSGGVLTANIASGTYRVYNNYKRAGYDNKQSAITGAGQILTNRPATSYAYANQPVVISFFAPSGQNYQKTFGLDSATFTGNGKAVMTSFTPDADGTFQVSGSVSGVTGTRQIKTRCAKHQTHTLIFLNAFGVWDSFTFVHGKFSTDVQRQQFEQLKWRLSGGSMVENTGKVYHQKHKVYAGQYTQKMTLTSDILSTGEYDWLQELVTSPQVYYVKDIALDVYPVTITESNYELKQDAIQKADFLQLTIQFDNQNTQYR